MSKEPLTITIHKPIHGTYCSIDKRKLIEAKREGRHIRVIVSGQGEAIVDPQWWWDTADRKENRVVNYPDRPMTFVYNTVPIKNRLEVNKNVSPKQLSLL